MGSAASEVVEQLIERGLRRGFLTVSEIRTELVDGKSSDETLGLVMAAAQAAGVEVVDGSQAGFTDPPISDDIGYLPNAVKQYLNEVARVPLLTARQEVELGMAKDAGFKAEARLAESGRRVDEGVIRLKRLVRKGKEAQEQLIRSNLRLVVSVARRYAASGVPLLDLVQDGNLGLMRAVEKFDYRMGYKFSTYATWWIRLTISRKLDEHKRLIRLPVNRMQQVKAVNRARRYLAHDLGREPTLEDLSAEMGVPIGLLNKLMESSSSTLSLDAEMASTGSLTIAGTLEDRRSIAPLAHATLTLLQEGVALALECLEERERKVVIMRFGLGDGIPCTLLEVSKQIGVTKERTRQIEMRALQKMRSSRRGRSIESFLHGGYEPTEG